MLNTKLFISICFPKLICITHVFDRCAGLRSYHVLGIVKDSEYDVGDEVVNTKRTVGWNAIKTDTEWRLVDISGAVRKLTSGNNSKWELIDDNGKVNI